MIANRAVTLMVNNLSEGLGAGGLGLVHRSHSTPLSGWRDRPFCFPVQFANEALGVLWALDLDIIPA